MKAEKAKKALAVTKKLEKEKAAKKDLKKK
jgi:hypothetical protein